MASVAVGGGLALGAEILSKVLTIAASPGGLSIIGHMFADKGPELDAAVAAMKVAPNPKGTPDAKPA